jgi:hypothetical protein
MNGFSHFFAPGRQGTRFRAPLYLAAGLTFILLSGCNPPEATTTGASPAASASPSSAEADAAQQNLAAAFNSAQTVLFAAKTPADLLKFTPLQQVQVAQDPGGLSITAAGNDPSVYVPAFPAKPCLVKVELTAPAAGVIQIFYLVGTQTTYNEQASAVQPLRAGDNTVYFKIDAPATTGQWRFDPGSAPGKYLLKSFEVRSSEAPPVSQ